MSRNDLINCVKNNFKIQELVCPHCYNEHGDKSW